MNTTLNRLDRLMIAITFAEANTPELAQEYNDNRKPTLGKRTQQTTKRDDGQIPPNQNTH